MDRSELGGEAAQPDTAPSAVPTDAAPLLRFVATAPRGLTDLLARELNELGAVNVRERPAAVLFAGSLALGYRVCLWSRIASRVLLQLTEFAAPSSEDFYEGVHNFDWLTHVDPALSIACEFSGEHPAIRNSHYGALRLKDGICDRLRELTGSRPDVELTRPALRLHAHANGTQISLSLDLAGESLHRRGYRLAAGEAPLRENVAAGVLLRAGWRDVAAAGGALLDPLCGSGTLVIEAALIAAGRAPGLLRNYFGFLGWRQHDAGLWEQCRAAARESAQERLPHLLRGSDIDSRVLADASANARRAGVADLLQFAAGDLAAARPAAPAGLVCTNPPYGVRLGDTQQVQQVYRSLGRTLRQYFGGWEAAILTGAVQASRALQLRSYRTHTVWNGALECRLLRIDLSHPGATEAARDPADVVDDGDAKADADADDVALPAGGLRAGRAVVATSPGAVMFANRLLKNLKRLGRESDREQASCYRLYDADMPEYAFAIDRYQDARSGAVHLHVQEYAPPATIDPEAARKRRSEALAVLPATVQVPRERVHLRLRRRQSGDAQYNRLGDQAQRHEVREAGLGFLVNFDDYLDTGLFLDHRLTRARLRAAARDARFLNLFCYTASASVYAAAGGARSTTSVDLSNAYLDWAAENFRLNGMQGEAHALVRADCREWLHSAAAEQQRFELIFLDPPTFSNSKRMQGVLDVQRDHAQLIAACMAVLVPQGLLMFSTNAQRFRLDAGIEQQFSVADISAATIPFDFRRNARIHRCFEIRQR